eukprot:6183313-Pleurochrysis_carterae.AAC.4
MHGTQLTAPAQEAEVLHGVAASRAVAGAGLVQHGEHVRDLRRRPSNSRQRGRSSRAVSKVERNIHIKARGRTRSLTEFASGIGKVRCAGRAHLDPRVEGEEHFGRLLDRHDAGLGRVQRAEETKRFSVAVREGAPHASKRSLALLGAVQGTRKRRGRQGHLRAALLGRRSSARTATSCKMRHLRERALRSLARGRNAGSAPNGQCEQQSTEQLRCSYSLPRLLVVIAASGGTAQMGAGLPVLHPEVDQRIRTKTDGTSGSRRTAAPRLRYDMMPKLRHASPRTAWCVATQPRPPSGCDGGRRLSLHQHQAARPAYGRTPCRKIVHTEGRVP